MIFDVNTFDLAKLSDCLRQKVLVDIVVEIFKGDLNFGRLPHVVGVDDEPRNRKIQRFRLLQFPEIERFVSGVFGLRYDAEVVVGFSVVANHFLLKTDIDTVGTIFR